MGGVGGVLAAKYGPPGSDYGGSDATGSGPVAARLGTARAARLPRRVARPMRRPARRGQRGRRGRPARLDAWPAWHGRPARRGMASARTAARRSALGWPALRLGAPAWPSRRQDAPGQRRRNRAPDRTAGAPDREDSARTARARSASSFLLPSLLPETKPGRKPRRARPG